MKKTLFVGLLAIFGAFSLSACGVISSMDSQREQETQGDHGSHGVFVSQIEKTGSKGNVDIYTIEYSNGKTSTFTVTNGTNGKDGRDGAQGIRGETGKDGHTPIVTISKDGYWVIDGEKTNSKALGVDGDTPYVGDNGNWHIGNMDTGVSAKGRDGRDGITPHIGDNGHWYIGEQDTGIVAQGPKGDKGDKGDTGKDGRSVVSIEKTSSDGNFDTYTIYYSDGTTSTFEVTNGENGEQGIEGKPGKDGHTPIVTISKDGYWVIDGVKTGNSAVAQNGKSAYELYCEQHPEYKGSEEDWIRDIESGKFRKITIVFDTDGGTPVESVKTTFGSYIQVQEPTKEGFDFVGWSLNGSMIDINTYVFFTDCTLKAVWDDARYITVTFDANGGIIVPSSFTVEYGKEYTLPEPSKKYQKFAGWRYRNTSIPTSGTWTYTHDDIELSASWTATNVYVDLEVDAEYGSINTNRATLQIGDRFTLPVPTCIKEGYAFTGWYEGNKKITDKDGKSLNICEFQNTTTLRAAYYMEIATIYDFMKLSARDLKGNYLVTNDLDFKGMIVNSINSLTGTFDGGGHTLSNFILSTEATSAGYGGLFGYVNSNSQLLNVKLDNISCSEPQSSGLVGKLIDVQNILIDNISISNSFNDVQTCSVLVGYVADSELSIKNIEISKSGNKCNSFGIYKVTSQIISDAKELVSIDGFEVSDVDNANSKSCGIIYTACDANVKVNRYFMNGNVCNGVAGSSTKSKINVFSSEINGITSRAWSYVTSLKDVKLGAKTKDWGCKIGIRCIDTANDLTLFKNVELKSSILLYPDANGVRNFYSSSGTRATFNDPSIVNKDMLISMLGLSEDVWNLDNIDIQNSIYPHIKK